MKEVIVVIGPGSIGQAIARRVSFGKHIVLADVRDENAQAAALTLRQAGFEVTATTVDVASRASVQSLVKLSNSIGISPTMPCNSTPHGGRREWQPNFTSMSAGGHGFDLKQKGTTSDHWFDELVWWMQSRRMMGPSQDSPR